MLVSAIPRRQEYPIHVEHALTAGQIMALNYCEEWCSLNSPDHLMPLSRHCLRNCCNLSDYVTWLYAGGAGCSLCFCVCRELFFIPRHLTPVCKRFELFTLFFGYIYILQLQQRPLGHV